MTDAETIEALAEQLDTPPADLLEHAGECPGCGTSTKYAPGIGPYCPSKACGRLDDLRPTETPSLAEDYDAMKNSLAPHVAAEGGPMSMGRPDRWWESFTVRCPNDHVSTRVIKTERGDECQACGRGCALTFPEDRDGPLTMTPITETPNRMTDADVARLLQTRPAQVSDGLRARVAEAEQACDDIEAGCIAKACIPGHQAQELLDAYDGARTEVKTAGLVAGAREEHVSDLMERIAARDAEVERLTRERDARPTTKAAGARVDRIAAEWRAEVDRAQTEAASLREQLAEALDRALTTAGPAPRDIERRLVGDLAAILRGSRTKSPVARAALDEEPGA